MKKSPALQPRDQFLTLSQTGAYMEMIFGMQDRAFSCSYPSTGIEKVIMVLSFRILLMVSPYSSP